MFERSLVRVRAIFCEAVGIAEELVPLKSILDFFRRHQRYARLPLMFPQAHVVKDALPWHVVDAYRKTFAGQTLPNNGFANMRSREYDASWRAGKVAADAGYIALPRAWELKC